LQCRISFAWLAFALPFALAGGGSFTTVKPSQHARTAADVIDQFTGQRWLFEQQPSGRHLVRQR
jgi:RNA 3'-terminal phosphate cyclase (ATP)